MPYRTNDDLPPTVRNVLPYAAQSVFRSVVNGRLAADASDASAFKQAWAVVGRSWEKPTKGDKWVAKLLAKQDARTLYVRRNVLNADEIVAWAKDQGFKTTIPADKMHVTLAFSKEPVDWPDPVDDHVTVGDTNDRHLAFLGPSDAAVLHFDSPTLETRWQQLCDAGCSWDYEGYKPHITISWNAKDMNLDELKPYTGPIALGAEVFEEVNEKWADTIMEKQFTKASVIKVDAKLGLVFGWAIVCKERNAKGEMEAYFDTQGDYIPEESMLKATTEFMASSRAMKEMHRGKQVGDVVFAWPLTEDVAKAMGLKSDRYGLMIAVKPHDPAVLKLFAEGKYTGFSLGGNRVSDEVVE